MPSIFYEYVQSPNRAGILTSINHILRHYTHYKQPTTVVVPAPVAVSTENNPFLQLTTIQRDSLRTYISTIETVKTLSGKF